MNNIVAGDYKECYISVEYDRFVFHGLKEHALMNAKTVKAYELVTEETSKSAASGIARGLIGGALLGGVGMVAGAMSAKNKGTYTVAVEFMDGKRSLLELDKSAYDRLVKILFNCGKATEEEFQEEVKKFHDEIEKKSKSNKGCLKAVGIVFAVIVAFILFGVIINSLMTNSEEDATQQTTEKIDTVETK